MRNVIVFSLGGAHHAVELHWVREVVTLGWVTPVPNAHGAVAGVCNYHGAIVPVVDLEVLAGRTAAPARAHPGEGAVVIAVADVLTALRTSMVDEVTSLATAADGQLRDSRGRPLELLDPPALIDALRAPPDEPGGHEETR
jgi:chemotaxis signal transduction protein